MSFNARPFALYLTAAVVLCPSFSASAPAAQMPVTLESLLHQMIDRDELARFPDPPYVGREFTSYDRRSISPDKPGWFANNDQGNFIRVEENGARKEWVMMDAAGPGSIVCFFKASTDPDAIVRIYLDECPTPIIEENLRYLLGGGKETDQERHFKEKRVSALPSDELHFLGGFGTLKPPFAGVQSLGCDMYLPIPYAKHCKVTYDKPGKCYYRINYRTYAPGTPVETFSLANLKAAAPVIDQVGKTLLNPPSDQTGIARTGATTKSLAPGESIISTLDGPAAISYLSIRFNAKDMPQALRSTVLSISFDNAQTVWCPIGDFFSSGIGIHPCRTWAAAVDAVGTLRCFWVMPFQKNCLMKLTNFGKQPVEAAWEGIGRSNWNWDNRSMYFHGTWRQQYPIATKGGNGTADWNYVQASGRGVYVGDTLVMHNASKGWWGEGDEKVWVDAEPFPSHFGTGTEDYYGYSRGGTDSMFFEQPFGAHPQVEGDYQTGYSALTRIRGLDAISFTSSLKFDMEIWHWRATTVAYAAATYWYGLPGAFCNRIPDEAEASRPVLEDSTLTAGR